MKWCLLAAGQGLMQAQAFLAGAYADGIGVPKDDVVAYSWANLAAAQGDETARKLRDVLERRMTQEQIGEAQRRSREFKPKVLDSSAVK
jgi:TPR repeat protein